MLFDPITLGELEMSNRIWVSPMCQYSATDQGVPTDWHLVHLGSRAVGGAGMVIAEAAGVAPEGRISPADIGIWSDEQAEAFKPITRFIAEQGSVPAIQLAHAGRKASTNRPWLGGKPIGPAEQGWQPVGPSPMAFHEGYPEPHELTTEEVRGVVDAFASAAQRATSAGFQAIEVHAAHGYLLHQFLSPHTNLRSDEYGGSFEARTRLAVDVARAVRESFPANLPVLVRLSASEYVEDGWNLAHSIALAGLLKDVGIDMIDVSSGGNLPHQQLKPYPGYQVAFAREIRAQAGIPTAAVGLITDPAQAEAVVASGDADVVLMGRELLRDPYWPLHAAETLGAEIDWAVQYQRAKPSKA